MALHLFSWISIFFLCTTYSLPAPSKSDRIIGGSNAEDEYFGFAVAINVFTATSRFFCTGSLMSPSWTITSGTCVNDAAIFTVQVGSAKLDDPEATTIATDLFVIHPDFDAETLKADLGMIKFRVPLADSWDMAILYTYWNPAFIGDSVVALGWGQTRDDDTNISNHLKYVNVTVISNEQCRIYYGNQVTENMTCVVGSSNQGICIGDTGGPLIYYGLTVIAGVASFLSGNGCETAEPSGYTQIAPYWLWIDETIFCSEEEGFICRNFTSSVYND